MHLDSFQNLRKEVDEIIDRNPTISSDNAFVAWFLRAFIVEKESVAVDCLKGGSRDKGVDAIYVDHATRSAFLLQGKYHQGNSVPSAHRSDVIALADLGRMLMQEDNRGFNSLLENADIVVKDALSEVRSKIQRSGYRLNLQFVTTGKISPTHLLEAEQRIEDWQSASYQGFGREDLNRLMQDYIEGAAPPTPVIVFPIDGQEAFKRFDEATGITSWIFTMKGSAIANIFHDVGVRLFARNIRGFLGNTDINRGMQITIDQEPEYFWYFNNGITVVCDKAQQISARGSNQLKIANAQIINGQQTTRSLSMQKNNDAEVLIKLIEIPRESSDGQSKYSRIVNQIVSATNWQNAISPSDLKANDPEQVRIERDFRKLGYHYLRKKMSKSEARSMMGGRYKWVIKKEDIARYVASCDLDPYILRLGKDRLFEDDLYPKIFDGRRATEYLLIYWFCRLTAYWSRGDSRRGYAKWIVFHFLWSKMKSGLLRPAIKENFRYAAERSNTYWHLFQPLNRIADATFTLAVAFYRKNKVVDGTIQDASSYFKHKGLHKAFEKFWDLQPSHVHGRFEKKSNLLLRHLESIER